jgi:hypothetical protein
MLKLSEHSNAGELNNGHHHPCRHHSAGLARRRRRIRVQAAVENSPASDGVAGLNSRTTTLKHLASRLTEQRLEVAAMRAALEAQAERIAHMQAELDLWPHSPGFRQAIRALSAERS